MMQNNMARVNIFTQKFSGVHLLLGPGPEDNRAVTGAVTGAWSQLLSARSPRAEAGLTKENSPLEKSSRNNDNYDLLILMLVSKF